jgi:hypothetical protein
MKCDLCGKWTKAFEVNCKTVPLPNTLTGLPDHNNPKWQCKHCLAWN